MPNFKAGIVACDNERVVWQFAGAQCRLRCLYRRTLGTRELQASHIKYGFVSPLLMHVSLFL